MGEFIFLTAAIVMVVTVVVVLVLLHGQQITELRLIRERLSTPRGGGDADLGALREERGRLIDWLRALDAEVVAAKRESLTEEELREVDRIRARVKEINAIILEAHEWGDGRSDRDWADIFNELPTLKSLYTSAD